jgi:hypothetical protein
MQHNHVIRLREVLTGGFAALRRQESMKRFLMLFLGVMFSLTTTASMARASGGPVPSELVWGNDELYRILEPKLPLPAASASQEPFYIIGTVGTTQSSYGPFDHVIPVPARNGGDFSAVWHAYWVEAGPNATPANVAVRSATTPFGLTAGQSANFVYAADLSGTGTLVLLTSEEKVEEAIALGLATPVDTGIVFTCPVVPVGTGRR